jgi:hypothetical protein
VAIPPTIRAGDTVTWQQAASSTALHEAITSADWSLTYYLRSQDGSGATAAGTAQGEGWLVTLAAAVTATFTPGQWFWQAVAERNGEAVTISTGNFIVQPGLETATDGRSQTRKDLEAVQAAIRTIVAGGAVQQYSIGNRQLSRYRLQELLELESRLKAQLKREEAAELMANGLGNPGSLYVRF